MMSITHNKAVVLALTEVTDLPACAVTATAIRNDCGAWHGY
jgi:hypothetical protein